jgi:CRISPR-associated endonuclease/helicase Cas3
VLYAHSVDGRPESDWEPLEAHLTQVAHLAARFAGAFRASDWGWLVGLWHDVGKVLPDFQARLRGAALQVEHAGLGAALADSRKGVLRSAVAFAIAGHHAGLCNESTGTSTGQAPLSDRLRRSRELLPALSALAPAIRDAEIPPPPAWLEDMAQAPAAAEERRRRVRRSAEMFTRFIFSALVDADRLATERFFDPKPSREQPWPALEMISARLDEHLANLRAKCDATTAVNVRREEVLRACQLRATDPAGTFTLTVPTGGGKTLAAMSFALRHALANGHRRVIVVIPYTSIIEQNAAIYRDALGNDAVVEHHTNFDEESAHEESVERETRRRWATENWDAPIIVTTSVQFLETLFTNRPSKGRKLHNVARSVVVMDEVQTLPPEFLAPILDGLDELREHYGCSVVLSTATPPSLVATPARPFGLRGVTEIIANPGELASALRRVAVRWPEVAGEATTWDALAGQLVRHAQVLTVVHRRKDARLLAEQLPPAGRFHLSASMCPAHRTAVLSKVRARLLDRETCRLVSTQLVEAGVDIDFPVVFRALAGLDSLAQAAGRCNREGRLCDESGEMKLGEFVVFRAETDPPPGVLRRARDVMQILLAGRGDSLDIQDPVTCQTFFDALYSVSDLDVKGIQTSRRHWNFADVGSDFRLIDDYTRPLVIPWGESRARVDAYRRYPCRETRRGLQPFVVTVRPSDFGLLTASGAVEQLDDAVYALTETFQDRYSEEFGLQFDEAPVDPIRFIV